MSNFKSTPSSPAFQMNWDQIYSTIRGAGYAIGGALAAYLLQISQTVDQSSATGIAIAAGAAILGNALVKLIPAWK